MLSNVICYQSGAVESEISKSMKMYIFGDAYPTNYHYTCMNHIAIFQWLTQFCINIILSYIPAECYWRNTKHCINISAFFTSIYNFTRIINLTNQITGIQFWSNVFKLQPEILFFGTLFIYLIGERSTLCDLLLLDYHVHAWTLQLPILCSSNFIFALFRLLENELQKIQKAAQEREKEMKVQLDEMKRDNDRQQKLIGQVKHNTLLFLTTYW